MAAIRRGSVCACLLFLAWSDAQGQAPSIRTNGTLNSADYSRSVAPGAHISVFGANLASTTAQASAFPLPTSLAGASVELVSTGTPIPLWYASPNQINAELPFSLPTGQVQLRVRTAAGASNVDTITVSPQAPKIFTVDFSGSGSAVATTTTFQVLTSSIPAKPAGVIILWMNSMGATTGSPVAGQPAPGLEPGTSPLTLLATPTVTINGANAQVLFAGLSPGSSGLYQVNVLAPFEIITGPVAVQVSVGGSSTQGNVTLPYRQLGFYHALLGGKAVGGQTLNGVGGATSALALRQSDQITWGPVGLNAWTNNTGLGQLYAPATGLALTLLNGNAVVYDNNGIEDGSGASFYNNAGGPADNQKPGLSIFFSMANYFPLTFAGYFRLAQATTVTEIVGYFDPVGDVIFPFDPLNPFVRYRMNIWSNVSPNLPSETGGFVGDVFSSDGTPGAFIFSETNVALISSDPADIPRRIFRLSYRLTNPLNLAAGEYWFSHDASIRQLPASSSTAPAITVETLESHIRSFPIHGEPIHFNLAGRALEHRPSWTLPTPVVVRPSVPVVTR